MKEPSPGTCEASHPGPYGSRVTARRRIQKRLQPQQQQQEADPLGAILQCLLQLTQLLTQGGGATRNAPHQHHRPDEQLGQQHHHAISPGQAGQTPQRQRQKPAAQHSTTP